MATQPIERHDEDIFDVQTQRIINDDVYDAATQLLPGQNDDIYDAATQLQPDTNDIFDALTQRLTVRNGSEEPVAEPSSGIPSSSSRIRAFESQLSPVMTPEWSMAKLIPKEPTNDTDKSISKKEENLKRKQQWIFNVSDDEGDNDDDDLDFDLTPNRQNDSVRRSMFNSSTESKSANRKSDPKPQNNSKTVDRKKPAESLGKREPDNEAPISNNVSKPAKRTRALSIVLSRNEVSEYFKSDNQMSVSSNLVENSKQKAKTTPKETSTPKNDGKSKKKTELNVKGGSATKTVPKVNKTAPKEVPVTRNLRTKKNINSPVGKDVKNTLKRKSDDIDADENQKQPRKRATKATESMVPWKFRTFQSESKKTIKDAQKKEEKTKQPAKETKMSKPKVDKTPKVAPVLREVRFIHTIIHFNKFII